MAPVSVCSGTRQTTLHREQSTDLTLHLFTYVEAGQILAGEGYNTNFMLTYELDIFPLILIEICPYNS